MKLFLLIALALAAGMAVAPATLARSQEGGKALPQDLPPPSAVIRFDLGTVEGSTYTNEYFGVSFTAPKAWTILDVGVMKGMQENAKGLFQNEKDAQLKRELEASVDRTTNLFSASKVPPGTPGVSNAALVCAAEGISTTLIKTPLEYYTAMMRSLSSAEGIDLEVVEAYRTKRMGATDFGAFTLKATFKTGVVMQKFLILIKGPYAFAIVFNYVDESDARTFDEVVSSMRVK